MQNNMIGVRKKGKMRSSLTVMILLFVMIFTCSCTVSGITQKYTSFDLYNRTMSPISYSLSEGKTISAYVNPTRAITGFEIVVRVDPTEAKKEDTITMSVYRYEVDYASSIADEPLASTTFSDIVDGQKLYFQFEDLEAGRYILAVSSNGKGFSINREAAVPEMEDLAHFYYQTTRIETGAFAFSIVFRSNNVRNMNINDLFKEPDYSAFTSQ